MKRLALDTNAYTALGTDNTLLQDLAKKAVSIGLPVIVLGEIYYGMFNGTLRQRNNSLLATFLDNPRVELLHVNEETAKLFGEIATELKRLGKPTQQNDVWIAALCKQHNYILATNDKAFANITGLETVSF